MTRGSSTPRAHPRSNSPCRLTWTTRKLQSRSPLMLLVARKNLFAERTRLGISVGGVALSVFLIGILLSLYRGWSQQVGGFVEHVPADLWATSDGTTDFVAAGSVLPDSLGVQLKLLPEVDVVSPLIVRPMQVYRAGTSRSDTFDIQLVGYDPKVGLGGPLEVAEGKSPPGPGEAVVDIEMHKRYGVQIGDRLVKGTKSLVVSGFSRGGDFIYTQTAFATIYTATVEKSREYGILKAEGFTNPYLYRVVFEQSMITGTLGFLLGAGVTLLLAPFAQDTVPQFVVWVRWQDIAAIAAATLVMSLVAAYIPVRRLSNIDPVMVFKG